MCAGRRAEKLGPSIGFLRKVAVQGRPPAPCLYGYKGGNQVGGRRKGQEGSYMETTA